MISIRDRLRFWIRDIHKLGFYHILSVNTLSTVLGFASQLFVVWILTSEEIGQIRIMQSFLSYAVLIGGLGFNNSTLKLCSEDRPLGEKIYLYRRALIYATVFALCSLVVFLILNYLGLLIQNRQFKNPLSLLLLSVLPMTINGIDISYLQSLREFVRLSRIQMITRLSTIILIIALTYFFGLYGFILANLTGTIFSSSMIYNVVSRINRGEEPIRLADPFRMHMKYSGFAFMSNVTYQASLFLDMVLLNYLVKDNPEGIGSYGFATIVISFMTLITLSFQQVVIPLFSKASTNLGEWNNVYKKYRKIYITGVVLSGLLAMTFLPFILEIVFGNKYSGIGLFVTILSLAWIFKSIYALQSSAMFGLGQLKLIFISSLILVSLGLPLNLLMINIMGVIGAGIANVMTSFVGLFIYYYAFTTVLKKQAGISDNKS